MSKFDHKKIMPRYSVIAIIMTLLALAVIGKTLYTMTANRQYWMKVAEQKKKDSISVKPLRGNNLRFYGQLMAGSLPEFKLYMDFQALKESKNDSLWLEKLDSICMGLNRIFPEQSAEDFKKHLEEGRLKVQKDGSVGSRHWLMWKSRVAYNTLSEIMMLPVLNMPFNYERTNEEFTVRASFKSGFNVEEYNARKHPFGSLAQRTVGDMFGAKDVARCGLELSYDSILRGENGIIHRRKVRNKYLDIVDTAPIDGADIITTIDVSIQDLAERALLDELKEIDANVGVAIVMEVATGDIKAIVNMEKKVNGEYGEIKNHAVSDLLEPGSVFKTASLLVALDDGVCDTNKIVETGGGVWPMYGREMKDHNWRRGGYGTMNLPKTLMVSSNIGVSRIIDEYYHKEPEKFVQGLYDLGLAEDLHIPLVGSTPAKIRMPKKDSKGKQYLNWSNTALPWMSIGYETQVPPITTITFYNGIANNGKMMRPRFVKAIKKDGEIIKEFPPVVVREHMAKESTIKTMQTILEHVVSQGLGKKAGSPSFKVAGKTGTAQISQGAGGYHAGTMRYLISFAGFFPADAPKYSCIVCIQKSGAASGGGMCGPVFRHIAEGIMAQNLKQEAKDAKDSTAVLIPSVKSGNLLAADYVLHYLGFGMDNGWQGKQPYGDPVWGIVRQEGKKLAATRKSEPSKNVVPDVTGMGARDAVFLMESLGIKVRLEGRGKVIEQSIAAGKDIAKGMICTLKLS